MTQIPKFCSLGFCYGGEDKMICESSNDKWSPPPMDHQAGSVAELNFSSFRGKQLLNKLVEINNNVKICFQKTISGK